MTTKQRKQGIEEYSAIVTDLRDQLIDGIEAAGELLPVDELTRMKIVTIIPNVIRQIFSCNEDMFVVWISQWDTPNTKIRTRHQVIVGKGSPKFVSAELISTMLIPLLYEIVPQVFKTEAATPYGVRFLLFSEWLIRLVQRATKHNFFDNIMATASNYSVITRKQMDRRSFDNGDADTVPEPTVPKTTHKKLNPTRNNRIT